MSDEFGNPISPQQYDSLQREIIETQQDLQNLQREAENSRTALVKIGEAGATMEKVGDKISGAGEKLLPLTAGMQAAATIFGKQNMSGMLAIINASEEDYNKLTSAIYGCEGTAKNMADTMQDNLAGQLTILKSQLEELAISFGEILMPTIQKIFLNLPRIKCIFFVRKRYG